MSENTLYVPMMIRVLLIGELPKEATFSKLTNQYMFMDKGILGDLIEPDVMSAVGLKEDDKGSYIQWSLPDAFTEGMISQDGTISYPDVPNRWLVTRIWTTNHGIVESKSFLVESDALERKKSQDKRNLLSASYPYVKDEKQPFRYIGRSFPINITMEKGEEQLEHLQAVAPGNPCFAAYYYDSCNVFSIFDDMTDNHNNPLEGITVSYVITGWYQNGQQDIQKEIRSIQQEKERFSFRVTEGLTFPAKTICHGMVSGIKWIDKDTLYDSGIPSEDAVKIAIGNTSMEAVSALIESIRPQKHQRERMTNLLLNNTAQILSENNGLLKAKDKVHNSRFGYVNPQGQLYIRQSEDYTVDLDMEVDLELYNEAVIDLNKKKIQLCNLKNQLDGRQEKLYDTFYKYLFRLQTKDEQDTLVQQYLIEMMQYGENIDDLRNQIMYLEGTIVEDTKILDSKIPKEYRLVEENGQRYYQPNDPVVLLYGVGKDESHGMDTNGSKNGLLFCRRESELIQTLTMGPVADILTEKVSVTGDRILDTPIPEDKMKLYNLPDECVQLINETILITPDFSSTIATVLLDQINISDEKKKDTLMHLIQYAQMDLRAEEEKQVSIYDGVSPALLSLQEWKAPWSPLYLAFDLTYYPDSRMMEEIPDFQNWTLQGDDYVFTGELPTTSKRLKYREKTVLTPYVVDVMSDIVNRVLDNETLADEVQKLSLLSQKINGFHERLLMRRPSIQIPITFADCSNTELKAKLSLWLAGYNTLMPEFDEFFAPIRAGFMKIDEIHIVDSFGQMLSIQPKNVIVCENMRKGDGKDKQFIMLPPRFDEVSRLNVSWMNSDNTAVSESSICGWLLPNHMDQSISCFGAKGNFLGSLQRVYYKDRTMEWRNPPRFGGNKADLPTYMDPVLRTVIQSILDEKESEGCILDELLLAIDSSLWNINPTGEQLYDELALFVGRPLAVIRAEISLEQERIRECKVMPKGTHNPGTFKYPHIDEAVYPVQVGRTLNHGDGLIGYYEGDEYHTLHLCSDEVTTKSSYFSYSNTISIRMGYENRKVLTFLLDCAGNIDFITGFLPVKSMKMDENIVKEGMDSLQLSLLCAPTITEPEITLPYPQIKGRTWEFLTKSNSGEINVYDELHQVGEKGYFGDLPNQAVEGWLNLRFKQK